MANALQDQLLKAGLTSKQSVKNAKTQKRRDKKANVDDGSAVLKQQIAEQKQLQAKKDKQLNEQRFNEATEKGQVKGLISEFIKFAISIPKDAETKFNYTLEKKIFSVYINDKIQGQLLNGSLGIIRYEDKSYLVPHKLAVRVNLLVPQWCGYLWDSSAQDAVAQVADADDPYANYAIPDDLMW
jgi:hypothetical protein